jgi:hypothetical protein
MYRASGASTPRRLDPDPGPAAPSNQSRGCTDPRSPRQRLSTSAIRRPRPPAGAGWYIRAAPGRPPASPPLEAETCVIEHSCRTRTNCPQPSRFSPTARPPRQAADPTARRARAHLLWLSRRRRSSRRPETRGPAEAIVAPTPLALQCSLADCWLLNHASRGHGGWLAAAVGNQRQAMLVLALRVRKHRALGDLHPPRRRRESNGFLTRAVEGDGMRVR